ncbi:hypothetical protein [Yinghuangia sp. YIM S09857]|uniref:hypothetical protein n=1 Tax=Yinghuangia sp. YIM S09857 TaxID=3436929 RepID=UPI003F5304BE
MNEEFIRTAITAYTELYGEPTCTRRFSRSDPAGVSAVVIYLPNEIDRKVAEDNVTSLWTAGFGAVAVCSDFPCEIGMEIQGSLDDSTSQAMARALIDLAATPLQTGRLFRDGQIVTNVALPGFPRFGSAMLMDWESVYGFRFPEPLSDVGCLRVVPLFDTEADFVESHADRHSAYRALRFRGMNEMDPGRAAVA